MKTRPMAISWQATGLGSTPRTWVSEAPAPPSGSQRGRSENHGFGDGLFLIFWCHCSFENVMKSRDLSPERYTPAKCSLTGPVPHLLNTRLMLKGHRNKWYLLGHLLEVARKDPHSFHEMADALAHLRGPGSPRTLCSDLPKPKGEADTPHFRSCAPNSVARASRPSALEEPRQPHL